MSIWTDEVAEKAHDFQSIACKIISVKANSSNSNVCTSRTAMLAVTVVAVVVAVVIVVVVVVVVAVVVAVVVVVVVVVLVVVAVVV